VDLEKQLEAAGGRDGRIVPKRSYLNNMNPWHGFPVGQSGRDLRDLFAGATVLEAMLVALEHMQVHFVLARRTRLPKFVKNVISFPQDFAGLASRLGLLQQYRAGDRVNSVRGPGGEEARVPKWARDASEADCTRFATDERGYLVFPATVKEVLSDGRLVLIYDFGLGEGVELPEQVWPRVMMPWHPRFLKGQTKILLRRNVGHGRSIEGLEVNWSKVARILQVLTRWGWWRPEGAEGPMHKYYDRRMFDMLETEEQVLAQYAPKGVDGNPENVKTFAGLVESGFDVAYVGPEDADGGVAGGVEGEGERCRGGRRHVRSVVRAGSADTWHGCSEVVE